MIIYSCCKAYFDDIAPSTQKHKIDRKDAVSKI